MRTSILATAALALILGGCAAGGASLSGTVSTAGVQGFGPDASAVQLSLLDRASGEVVASQSVLIEGRPAVAFRLQPDAGAGANYELRARVVSRNGAVLYRSADAVSVTLPSHGALDVTVEPAQVGG